MGNDSKGYFYLQRQDEAAMRLQKTSKMLRNIKGKLLYASPVTFPVLLTLL